MSAVDAQRLHDRIDPQTGLLQLAADNARQEFTPSGSGTGMTSEAALPPTDETPTPGNSEPLTGSEALSHARALLGELSVTEGNSFPFVATKRVEQVVRALTQTAQMAESNLSLMEGYRLEALLSEHRAAWLGEALTIAGRALDLASECLKALWVDADRDTELRWREAGIPFEPARLAVDGARGVLAKLPDVPGDAATAAPGSLPTEASTRGDALLASTLGLNVVKAEKRDGDARGLLRDMDEERGEGYTDGEL